MVVLTIIFAIATVVLAWFAHRQLSQAISLERSRQRPVVVFDLVVEKSRVFAVLRNSGTTPAYDVRVTCNPKLESIDELLPKNQLPIPFVEDSVPLLPPGKELKAQVGIWKHTKYTYPNLRFVGSVSFKDALREPHEDQFSADLSIQKQLATFEGRDIDDVAGEMKKLRKTLEQMTDRLTRSTSKTVNRGTTKNGELEVAKSEDQKEEDFAVEDSASAEEAVEKEEDMEKAAREDSSAPEEDQAADAEQAASTETSVRPGFSWSSVQSKSSKDALSTEGLKKLASSDLFKKSPAPSVSDDPTTEAAPEPVASESEDPVSKSDVIPDKAARKLGRKQASGKVVQKKATRKRVTKKSASKTTSKKGARKTARKSVRKRAARKVQPASNKKKKPAEENKPTATSSKKPRRKVARKKATGAGRKPVAKKKASPRKAGRKPAKKS